MVPSSESPAQPGRSLPIAEVVAIGDEMTSGERLDTNSQWLSHQLENLGLRVMYHTTVGDQLAALRSAFATSAARADVVVSTGGLGPTADDLTREGLAATLGVPLEEDEEMLAHIRAMYTRRGREMPPRNAVQATRPHGAAWIANPQGTAPGLDLKFPRSGGSCRWFAVPGVPVEMREMWESHVGPALESMLAGKSRRTVHRCIKCFGVGESDLEAMLPDLIRRGREPEVGITVSRATITLRVSARGPGEAECRATMQPTIDSIYESLGDLVFGEGESTELQHVICRALRESKSTLATLEVATGGLFAHWLHDAETADSKPAARPAVIRGSQVFTERDAADAWARRRGGSEHPTPDELAELVRAEYGADVALVIDGPQEPQADVAVVPISVADSRGTNTHTVRLGGHPDVVLHRIVKHALNLLRMRG